MARLLERLSSHRCLSAWQRMAPVSQRYRTKPKAKLHTIISKLAEQTHKTEANIKASQITRTVKH